MSSIKYDIPQLDRDTRFALWQVKMRAVLTQAEVDDALDKFGNKDSKSWTDEEKRKDRKALTQIQLHLSNNILQDCLQENTAAALWRKLESLCMSKDLTSKMHLKMKLYTHKLQEGGSVINHLSVFKEIVSNLQSMEVDYDDEDLALILLCSLPSSFSNFRDTLLYNHDTLTLDEVSEALHAKEKMKLMVSSEGSASKGEALSVRGRTDNKSNNGNRGKSSHHYKGRSKSRNKQGDKFCKYCKKDNHFIDECYKLKNKEKRTGTYREKNKPSDEGNASVAASKADYSDGDSLVAFAGCANSDDEWILDSAASFHICINRDWFVTYDSVQGGGSVRLGDDTPLDIVGIGSIQIKMHDGIVRTLADVRHIPSMSKNLISLSTLDAKGYKYSGGDGVLKVSKGSLIVMKSELKSPNLYHLRGTTITDVDNAIVQDAPIAEISPIVDDSSIAEHSSLVVQSPQRSIAADRSRRQPKPVKRYIEECNVAYAMSVAEEIEDKSEIAKLKAQLSKEFEMKDLGKAKKILESDKDIEYMSRVPYSSAVGSLMYAMVCSRPDLSHALSVVSRFMANPGKEHWRAVQWIFRYLRGTSNACLQFGKSRDGLVGYVDSDFAGDLDKRRSLTGYVFTIGGCAVSWKACLRSIVAPTIRNLNIWLFLKLVKKLFG
ncbi:unnamed protein product [Miscanthus lutarioriparius]|uniref:Retrovirus-related Pol polyprotein from transposon TNT 1-94-like beta-barrel domain-containing protein n=1 Tax=Miscanthus lutarioriparius TaxID=422564 RepID=A0A811M9G7_9POAL|nr:unnamed protein product [Miscanthus lutarioriparius]